MRAGLCRATLLYMKKYIARIVLIAFVSEKRNNIKK